MLKHLYYGRLSITDTLSVFEDTNVMKPYRYNSTLTLRYFGQQPSLGKGKLQTVS